MIHDSKYHALQYIWVQYNIMFCIMVHFAEGNLEIKFPTIWTNGKAEVGRVREEKGRRKKIREEKE